MPPKKIFDAYTEGIWDRCLLTNDGPLVKMYETEMRERFYLENFTFVSNGTLALQIAIKVLGVQGKVITTPFSYVATTSSIIWSGCDPVFCDINPESFNIDPEHIQEKITDDTTAILVTHVFGNPVDIEKIERIAKTYNLKVIYDAAHCIGVEIAGKSVLNFGDISCLSLHATKMLHSAEGGALVAKDAETTRAIELARNFGHDGPENFGGLGINAKNSEIHAAMGLSVLPFFDEILEKRRALYMQYKDSLSNSGVKFQSLGSNLKYNFSYMPVVFSSKSIRDAVHEKLKEHDIYSRIYFSPSLNLLDYVEPISMPHSENLADCILCLPLYYDLSHKEVELICSLIKHNLS